jgi:hypothetical protein
LLLRDKHDDDDEDAQRERSGTSEISEAAGPLSVVLEPTRELARQVANEARKIGAERQWRVAAAGEDPGVMADSGQPFSALDEGEKFMMAVQNFS